ncbi:MAG: ABC transporter permease [Bacteroidales bacterium]|nr:ABC transporter permease [Candidatus Equimonas enterica]
MNKSFARELYLIFHDEGILIFFIVVPLLYPLIYSFIYTDEVVRDVPVCVVDESHSVESRKFIRLVDATADVKVVAYASDQHEAQKLRRERKTYGYICIPSDFGDLITHGEQAHIGVFTDMSGMLYYKAIVMASTNASLEMNADIKLSRSETTTAEQDKATVSPIRYDEVALFNPQGGFAAFLIPAVLMLILHQTMLLGVGMSAGTRREQRQQRIAAGMHEVHRSLFKALRDALHRTWGRCFAYIVVFIPVSAYVLSVVPRIFNLVQIGSFPDVAMLMLPFLLAVVFFAETISHLVTRRETIILLIVFTSVPLLFLSGVSWPGCALPPFWHHFAMFFPSTFGINAFVKINTCGASLAEVRTEYISLWIQAGAYFVMCVYLTLWEKSREYRQEIAWFEEPDL